MKNIKNFIIKESQTKLSDIEKYVKSWITEYEPQKFNQVLNNILNGIKKGVEENVKYYKDEQDKQEVQKALTIIINLIKSKEEFLV